MEEELKRINAYIATLENRPPRRRVRTVPVDRLRHVCTAPKCVEYVWDGNRQLTVYKEEACHEHCGIAGATLGQVGCPVLSSCGIFANDAKMCMECGCSPNKHMQIMYITTKVEESDLTTAEEESLRNCKLRKEAIEQRLRKIRNQFSQ